MCINFDAPSKGNLVDRTERFYRIQDLLRQRKKLTMRELQDELAVSRSTLCRDIDYLRDRLGVPLMWNPQLRAYQMLKEEDGRHELPGIWFSEPEIHALLSMMELINRLEPEGLLAPKVRPLKERLYELLEQGTGSATETAKRIRIIPMAQRAVDKELFQDLVTGLVNRKRLGIQHFSRQSGKTTERQISPQRLIYYRDNWYLDAFCHLRDDLRSFAVDAIKNAKLLEKPAVTLGDTALQDFFEQSYGIFNGTPKHVAKLRFTPFRSQWVSKEVWHPNQRGQYLPDGSYELDIPYGEDQELIQDILKNGNDVEVIAPAELKEKVLSSLSLAIAQYTG